jgi:hypothetical protein
MLYKVECSVRFAKQEQRENQEENMRMVSGGNHGIEMEAGSSWASGVSGPGTVIVKMPSSISATTFSACETRIRK